LEDSKQQIADHDAGGRQLESQEEYDKLVKRTGLYEKKLERMGDDLDERVRNEIYRVTKTKNP
jgi:hypothetical protein